MFFGQGGTRRLFVVVSVEQDENFCRVSPAGHERITCRTRGTAPQRRRALVYYRISSHPIPITHHVSRHSHRTAYHSPSPGATDVFTTVAILACSKHLARFPFCKCRRVLRETYELLWFSDRQRGSNRDRTRIHRDRTATAPD